MLNQIKSFKKKLDKSKDGQVLASNFKYMILLQFTSYIFPLLTIPYLAKVVGVEGFGKIAFAAAVMVWFKTITDWGFNYTATRDVSRNREDLDKVSEIFSNVLWARVFLSLMSLLLLLLLIEVVPYFTENEKILFVTFLIVPGQIFFPEWFFQAMERMKFITIFNIASKTLFTALVFVFIKEKSDFILQPLFISLGYMVSGLGAMYLITVRWEIKVRRPNFPVILKTIKDSTDVFVNNLMPNLYNSFSVVLLGFFGGTVANGLLDAGSKFVNISQQFMNVISRVFFPFLSRKINKHDIYTKLHLLVSVVAVLLLLLLAPTIIGFFFTEEFYEAVPVLQIMSLSIIFTSLISIYGTNYMLIKGYERELRNLTIASSIIGFIISFPLIYYHGFIGAAITITVTRAILGLAITYKSYLLRKNNKRAI
ncbi:flippase [Pseudoalteromonas sp. NC201]|uniref:flippase n=1 Tax=Pseudoalteromonas sp. NC201 TaxID=1514074 RepID=UPI000C7A717F|nr:flippase [Pseudoalteromonas sp. NC201]AUJ68895.1 Putative O-antigen transporter [Pseudoalteromonas sp. NC201]